MHSVSTLPIADLAPSIDPADWRIHGVVTLIWPYSASQRSMSVLLAAPDFRLRRNKGQVRVTFRGASAQAIARLEIQSGDEVELELAGVQWVEEDMRGLTPGRGVDWGMAFHKWLSLQVGETQLETCGLGSLTAS